MFDNKPEYWRIKISFFFFFIHQPALGVTRARSALLYVILSPVGPYFKTGTLSPVALLADPSFVRAWPGGCGDFKMGGYISKFALNFLLCDL